jgi:hypothetical protein
MAVNLNMIIMQVTCQQQFIASAIQTTAGNIPEAALKKGGGYIFYDYSPYIRKMIYNNGRKILN